MNYYAESAFEYIQDKVTHVRNIGGAQSRTMVMVSSLPAPVTLALGKKLDSFCIEDGGLEFVYKVAGVLASEWGESPEYQEMKKRDWIDLLGNLTSYRNSSLIGTNKHGLLVLVGTDKVTDASGLADFHQCSVETVWQSQLKGSFIPWVEKRLSAAHVAYDENTIERFNMVLSALKTQGRGDILQIADLLIDLPLEGKGIQNGTQAENLLIRSLHRFGMPNFCGFTFGKRKSLSPYIENAAQFFSYSLFLEERIRDKALESIALLQREKNVDIFENRLFTIDQRGSYNSDKDFLDDLRAYVTNGDHNIAEKLRSCDFITIWDKILKFKIRATKPPKETIRKLTGGPVEVVLTALWQTLRDFKRETESGHPDLVKIDIVTERFKHDYECEFDDHKPAAAEIAQEAMAHLKRLVGGIDNLFNTRSEHNALDGYLDLSSAYGGQSVAVESHLLHDDIICTYARTAEPALEFRISLTSNDLEEQFSRKFAWRLPEIQTYRLAEELIAWAYDGLRAAPETWRLPVFHLPYYEELVRAKDDDEIRRVLLHCIREEDGVFFNMLSLPWLSTNDPLLPYLKGLAEAYAKFLEKINYDGLHAAFQGDAPGQKSHWDLLRQAYESAGLAHISHDAGCQGSPMAAMLMRAFLIIQQRPRNLGDAWTSSKYERSGVATVLHPAVLEMLHAHIEYLFACFNHAAVQELTAKPNKSFPIERWQRYVGLAAIQMPLSGLLCDENLVLDTRVLGQDLIHRLGSPGPDDATLSTRLLLRYEGFEDDDLTDSEIFRESSESKLLGRLMLDYLDTHPHARDGLSLAIYRNKDIQPVVAAVHGFLNKLASPKEPDRFILKPGRRKPYAIGVTLFTESVDEIGVSRWMEQWRERWEASESEDKFLAYRFCRFSIAHRIVSEQDGYDHFKRMIADSLEVDIAVLYDFIGAGRIGNTFENVDVYDVTDRTLRFPILEKAFCSINDPHHALQRSRIITNRQFRLGALHGEIMARLKNKGTPQKAEHIVLGFGDYTPWQGVIDELHKRAEWVVCVDPSIDERLIRYRGKNIEKAREIIGFGSGVGVHGEANYTVSTEKFSLSDISFRLEQSIRDLYHDWTKETFPLVAQSILREAQLLSGLSLVRATGIGTHIHDFMAYSLTRKMLHAEPGCFCDQLVTLDAYRHWFDGAEFAERPDLLWLTAHIGETGSFELDLKLIECKLGKQNHLQVEKAQKQIENGLRTLIPAFIPKTSDAGASDDNRPDQRYWWLQLHRLIASKTEITYQQQPHVLGALERLADGDYVITWSAGVFTFWTDSPSEALIVSDTFQFQEDKTDLSVSVFSMGHEFVRRLCINKEPVSVPWTEHTANFGVFKKLEKFEKYGHDREKDAEQGGSPDTPNDEVEKFLVKQTQTVSLVFEEEPKIPDRILLGETEKGGRKIYWEFGHRDLNNRHILVFGTSGMGKTYAIQCLLCELGKAGQNSLVLDYTNGFLPKQLEPLTNDILKPKQHIVRQKPLPISPFKLQSQVIADDLEIEETPVTAAKRIASTFKKLYGSLGDQQYPILMDAVISGLKLYGDKLTLEQFQSVLQSFVDDGEHDKTRVQSTINKLRPFILEQPFLSDAEGVGWLDLFSDSENRCHVFQFAGMDANSSELVIEFVLWDLNAFVRGTGSKNLPKVIVLDEVQNLDLGEGAPVAKYLTEGRKFGLSLILATQTMDNLKGDRLSRLFQAGHKLFFRPSENELQEHAKLIQGSVGGTVPEWTEKLSNLKKTECYSLGPSLNTITRGLEQMAFKIRVTSLENRSLHVR
jgi:DNA phosphorothioation-dependent restriction protein DptH